MRTETQVYMAHGGRFYKRTSYTYKYTIIHDTIDEIFENAEGDV